MTDKDGLIVWIDLEMTGLEPGRDRIIEIASIITDGQLNIVKEGPDLVVHQADAVLDGMDDWNRTHHGASGLADRVRKSRVSEAEAEEQTLTFVSRYVRKPRLAPLAGNSIHQDRRFLERYMPRLNAYLHYRNVDVSTVKELAKRWYPDVRPYAKENSHRALEDIRESIAELRHYRLEIFR